MPSAQPKKSSHSFKQYDVVPSSASDHYSDQPVEPRPAPSRAKKHTDKSKHKSRSRYLPSSSEEDHSSELRHRSPKPSRKTYTDQDHPQHDPDHPYYRDVALSDIKDAFDKFDQDFQAANLPEGKYIKAPPSTTKWYKVGQPCYEDKIQELNTDFTKICISPKPSGAPMGKVPLPILKELEHQARQNISTLNFTTTFAKTSSSCNSTLEKCQHSLKSTFKKVNSQIRKGADSEKAAKRGYEEACEYLDLWNKTLLIQHRALTYLSKSLSHILQRELYSMGNTGLLADMTLLQPHLGETRRRELSVHLAAFLVQVSIS